MQIRGFLLPVQSNAQPPDEWLERPLTISSTDLAVSSTVFSKAIGFQLNVFIVLAISASIVLPTNGNMPFISALKLAMNFTKKFGAKSVLTLLNPFFLKMIQDTYRLKLAAVNPGNTPA